MIASVLETFSSIATGIQRKWVSCGATGSLGCYFNNDGGDDSLLTESFLICLGFIVYSFVWSILGQNCSKVDQIWSITPMVYCWHLLLNTNLEKGQRHDRLLLVTTLVTCWGLRLTFNFWRRGGYGNFFKHEEDYRWPILRKKMHPILFLLFNLTFIATYQNVLLWWISMPVYLVYTGDKEVTQADFMLAVVFVVLLVMETVADQQQYNFQTLKYSFTPGERAKHPRKEIREGFRQSGLFAYCRHPNYFAEQAIWVVVYLFSAVSNHSHDSMNWTLLGCGQLLLLFQGSMRFSESITLTKYPSYKSYQSSTSMVIPWFPAKEKLN